MGCNPTPEQARGSIPSASHHLLWSPISKGARAPTGFANVPAWHACEARSRMGARCKSDRLHHLVEHGSLCTRLISGRPWGGTRSEDHLDP